VTGFLNGARAVLPKVGAGLAIAAVAATAGVISFGHIYELTLALHQSVLTARLMPVAIDGLITVGSVVLLQSGSRLGWLGVGPGLALSVFANVESGIRYGWLSAVWAGIPALSFFLATFILERWLKSQSSPARATMPGASVVAETVAAVIPAPPEVELDTVADTPVMAPAVPVDGPEDVATGDVPAAPPVAIHTVSRRRTPRRTSPGKPRAHAKIFAAEIERAELPSLREVMRRAGVGQSRGREILAELQETIDAQEVTADAA
jgi:hypothetical protein